MTALITGASSGMGREMAKNLAKRGFNIIIVARRRQRLYELKRDIAEQYGVRVKCLCHDLSLTEECFRLYDEVKKADVDILINNAGFGVFGRFTETDLHREMKMIDVNVKAVHILTKLFLKRFVEKDHGYILNVASLAGFMAGPFFSSYYASKNYVVQLTRAIHEELRTQRSNVYIGAFCPGPVNTEFNDTAGADFAVNGMNEKYAADYAIEKMFDGKLLILPGMMSRFALAASKYVPGDIMLAATGKLQSMRKTHDEKPLYEGEGVGCDPKLMLTEEELERAKREQ